MPDRCPLEEADSFSLNADSGPPWFIDAPDHVGSEVPVTLRGWLIRAEHSGATSSLLGTHGAHFSCTRLTSSRSLDCRSLSGWPRSLTPSSGVMSDADGAPLPPRLLWWGPAGVGWGCTVVAKDSGQSESFAGACHGEDQQRPCCLLCLWLSRSRSYSSPQFNSSSFDCFTSGSIVMRDDGRQAVGGHVTLPLQLFHFFEKTTPTIHTLLIAQQMSGGLASS